jgi:thiosulfate/3-mercaptopyruvate sulfurtransferase
MRRPAAALALLLALLAAPLASAAPDDGLLVSTAWLAAHLHDKDLVLLHVGDRAEYDAGHIPGARYLSLRDISLSSGDAGGLHLEMPAPDDLRSRLAALGISDASRIVVYYGKDWLSPTTRAMFTLDYAGLGGRASMLDGGQPAWIRDGHTLTADVPPAVTGALSPLHVRPLIVDAAWVKDHLHSSGIAIVDARDPEFYDGTRAGGGDAHPQRAGHIAGARSVPFSSTTDDAMMVRSPKDLEAVFERAGIKPGDTVVAYCHIGQQATSAIFAARLLGHPVLLYDGSFEDWSAHAGYPVTTGSQPQGAPDR